MKKLLISTLMLLLFAGLLTAQTPLEIKHAKAAFHNLIPRPAAGNSSRSTVLTEFEDQFYWGEWESDGKVAITYDNAMRVHSLTTRYWDYMAAAWYDEERETVTYRPDGKPEQVMVEYWDGSDWATSGQIDFSWDSGRLISILHQSLDGTELYPVMSQEYFYSDIDGRLEYVSSAIMMDFARYDIHTRVHLEWDAMGRVQTATMQFGDGIDWVDAYKTEMSYHPSDQSNYQTFMDFLVLQSTFGDHELYHIASQIKTQEELEYFMNEDTLEWDIEGKYEYNYDANLRLLQSNYYMVPQKWHSKEDWELVSREDFTYDAAGNMTVWLMSDVYSTEIEPFARTLYTYSEVTSNPASSPALRPSSLSVFPNPFNPNTTIAFELPKAEKIEMAVFNLKGQKVRELINEHKSAGKHQIKWDGKDDSSRPLSSGIYFLKLNAGQEINTQKLILQK